MITFAMFYWYELLYYKEILSIYWMTLVGPDVGTTKFVEMIMLC